MPKQINYSTSFSHLPLSGLRKLHQSGALLASIELILRSPFAGEGFDVQKRMGTKTEVTAEEAVQVARKQLEQYPDHPILNFVIGRELTYKISFMLGYSPNRQEMLETEKHLLKTHSINSTWLQGRFIATSLTYLYRHHLVDKPLEAMVWLAHGIIHESQFLIDAYLSNKFLPLGDKLSKEFLKNRPNATPDREERATWCLSECVLLTSVFAERHFQNFKNSAWLSYWNSETKMDFFAFNELQNALSVLDHPPQYVNRVLNLVINDHNPTVFYEFFAYGLENNILPAEICVNMLNIFIEKVKDQNLKDKANYSLFLYYAHQRNDQAGVHYTELSKSFKGFQVDDFKKFKQDDRNAAIYGIFKRLIKNNHFEEAVQFLNNVTDACCYDIDLFKFFDEQECFRINYDMFKFRKKITNQIVETSKEVAPEVWERASRDYVFLNNPSAQLYYAFSATFALIEFYADERYEQIKQQTFGSIMDGLTRGNKKRQEFFLELETIKKDKVIQTPSDFYWREDYQNVFTRLFNLLEEGKKQFSDKKFDDIYHRAKNILKDISTILEKISGVTGAFQSMQTVQPTAPPAYSQPVIPPPYQTAPPVIHYPVIVNQEVPGQPVFYTQPGTNHFTAFSGIPSMPMRDEESENNLQQQYRKN